MEVSATLQMPLKVFNRANEELSAMVADVLLPVRRLYQLAIFYNQLKMRGVLTPWFRSLWHTVLQSALQTL